MTRWFSTVCLIPILLISCSHGTHNPAAADSRQECRIIEYIDSLTASGNIDLALDTAKTAYNGAIENGRTELSVKLGARIGRLYYKVFKPDSMYHYFDAVTQKAEDSGMYPECIMIHSTIGVFNLINTIEYENAQYHFLEGMDYAEASGNMDAYYKLLVNVSIIHYIRKDSAGILSSREIYDYGEKTGKTYFKYMGALMSAYMYHSLEDDTLALESITEARKYSEWSKSTDSYIPLYASILASLGRDTEAERIFMDYFVSEDRDSTLMIEAYTNYGNFLSRKGRYKEAIDYYKKGLDITQKYHLYFYGYSIYPLIADLYALTGQQDLAIKYLNMFNRIKDNVFNVEKERSFNNLIRKYETQKNFIELQKKDLQLLRQKQLLELICCVLLISVILILIIIYRNRMLNRMYKQLIIKYNSYMEKEEKLMESIKAEASNPEDKRSRQLFESFASLMLEEKLYTIKNITIEDIASRIGTNRSYLSKAVNKFGGCSFNSYVNSLRIKASIRLLAEKGNAASIKQIADAVGYSNITSFYNNFTKETGVPPSKYRTINDRISNGQAQLSPAPSEL